MASEENNEKGEVIKGLMDCVSVLLSRYFLTGSLAESAGRDKPGAKDSGLMDTEPRL